MLHTISIHNYYTQLQKSIFIFSSKNKAVFFKIFRHITLVIVIIVCFNMCYTNDKRKDVMENELKYNNVFSRALNVNTIELHDLAYNSIPQWDTMGHIKLIYAIENAFNVSFQSNEIINFDSYEKGKQILKSHDIIF